MDRKSRIRLMTAAREKLATYTNHGTAFADEILKILIETETEEETKCERNPTK